MGIDHRIYHHVANFDDNNFTYPFQFCFRQKYSTTHALISLTEISRKYLDEGNVADGVFVDLQKFFDTVKHIGARAGGVRRVM